ncbi:response regulator transcription factor [Streptomyces sp. YC504]|uniref:Response regulator transcription factor n=2 Tax=Streptomyces mesophilus TaxID=1775132 RepID=A0A6G4XHH8_9ACTN|nr:response regulator transcription factor [Streptomyces mesophilus]
MQLAAFDSLARSLKAEAPAADVESPSATAEPERAALTDRESQVLTLVVRGCSNRQIARSLGISDHTVRTHLQSVFRKLEVSHRTEAAVVALREGLIDVDPLGP